MTSAVLAARCAQTMTDEELTCKELVEVVTDYLEGRMSVRERGRFEEHLLNCPGCSAYLEQLRWTIRLSGALREEHILPKVRNEFLAAFRR
jgi:predicted anti-sigma-YlaC factor YlaD